MAVAITWAAEDRKRSMLVIDARCSRIFAFVGHGSERFLDFARNDKRKVTRENLRARETTTGRMLLYFRQFFQVDAFEPVLEIFRVLALRLDL